MEAWRERITAIAAVALAVLVSQQHSLHSEQIPVQVIGQSLVAILSTSLIAYAVREGAAGSSGVQRALSAGWLRTAGNYSYAMYVFHFPIHQALKPFFNPWEAATDDSLRILRVAAYLTLVLLLTYGTALLSWRLIEKPFLDLKERWAPRAG